MHLLRSIKSLILHWKLDHASFLKIVMRLGETEINIMKKIARMSLSFKSESAISLRTHSTSAAARRAGLSGIYGKTMDFMSCIPNEDLRALGSR